MNYRKELEKLGFIITKSYNQKHKNISSLKNVSYTIEKDNRKASFKTLKEAFSLIDLWHIITPNI